MSAKTYVPSGDTGCEFAPSCLDCPFPECIYDYPGGKSAWLKKERNKAIRKLSCEGKTVKELATMFKLGKRQIERIVHG